MNNINEKLDNLTNEAATPKEPPIIKKPFESLQDFEKFDESITGDEEKENKLVWWQQYDSSKCSVNNNAICYCFLSF